MPSEFDLIRRYFTRPTPHTALGIGDDAALLQPGAGMQLAVSSDTLVSGVHFFPDTDPRDLGWKTLAVNLSDLAAMGAQPRWATLALTLPHADERWLSAFAAGFFACATAYATDLVGGDTTRGPLAMTVTIIGEVPPGAAITRSGGRAGDDIWISGHPGLAALGLAAMQGKIELEGAHLEPALAALHHPLPRLELGLALRGIAHAMLDVSDGLSGDLGHLCARSGCGAVLDPAALPCAPLLASGADAAFAQRCLLAGGDDYELLFSAHPGQRAAVNALARRLELPLHRIGCLTPLAPGSGPIRLRAGNSGSQELDIGSYDHFGA
ncbi:thiamine-monophosphate kinase [Betaproteobacteria bacterium]|nr:thiamine-monophosphate kinase [Betaproteobacteria bacterium]GHU31734.1 thiamine-monophosphate kinase [Betaproteobacteria bacterium]